MKIRHCKMPSGKIYTVYEVRKSNPVVGQSRWTVFCGMPGVRPRWVTLHMPPYNSTRKVPYFFFAGEKLYLSNFE